MEAFNARFKQIYISYFARIKRFACEYVIFEDDAENIIHDVFLEIWEKKDILSPSSNLVAVLFTSVKNKCIDHLRHRIVEQQAVDRLQQEHAIAMQMKLNSLEVLDQNLFTEKDIDEIISDAIALLPDKCREIFIKSKIEGKKQKQIAQELNISVNTVETQMGIAYKKLKENLKDLFPLFILILFIRHGV